MAGVGLTPLVFAEYEQEIRDQTQDVLSRYPGGHLDHDYFHDMGIIARKADEAGLNTQTSEIVGSLLYKRMDHHVEKQLEQISRDYEMKRPEASTQLQDLIRYRLYYQPPA